MKDRWFHRQDNVEDTWNYNFTAIYNTKQQNLSQILSLEWDDVEWKALCIFLQKYIVCIPPSWELWTGDCIQKRPVAVSPDYGVPCYLVMIEFYVMWIKKIARWHF